jgi:hypothetical protein
MNRRAFLGSLVAGCGALAGCGGLGDETDAPSDPSTDPIEGPPEMPPEAEQTRWEILQKQFGFEERVDAVDDLGWDRGGTFPIDNSLVGSFGRNVLIEVPPGEYKIDESINSADVSNWGILGTGKERREVRFTTNEDSRIEFKLEAASDVLLENFAFDQGDRFDRAIGMTFVVEDNLRIQNVEKAGTNPTQDPNGMSALLLNVSDPDGTAVVDTFVRTGPQDFLPYPENELCVYSGPGHRGTVLYKDLDIRNAGENGIYASKCPGDVHVEGGFYKNNRNDGIRISGEGSYVKDATVVIDADDFHPRNRGVRGQMRGIRMQSGDWGFTGGFIEGCDLELRSTFYTQGLVYVVHNQGSMTLRDTDLKNWTKYYTFRAEPPAGNVREPFDITLDNVRIEEHGRTRSAVKIDGRPNSMLRNVTIETEGRLGLRDGIVVTDSPETVFEDVSVETTGVPLRIERGSTSPEDYTIRFRGTNEFSTSGNFGIEASSIDLPIENDGTVYPFRDVSDDVRALLVTGIEDDRLSFRQVRS